MPVRRRFEKKDRERRVLEAHAAGMSAGDISATTGMTPKTVRQMLARAGVKTQQRGA